MRIGNIKPYGLRKDMLAAFGAWLDQNTDDASVVVSHNGRSFDWPKLRASFVREGVPLPMALASPDQPTADTMKIFCDRFSVSKAIMVSLGDACDALNLTHHKEVMTGEQVGQLLADGQVEIVARYCLLDVDAEFRLFCALTGRNPEAPALPGVAVGARDVVVVDIETAGGTRPERIEHDFISQWRPDPRWKDDTIAKRYREARAKFEERAALLDSAEIVVVGVRTERELFALYSENQTASTAPAETPAADPNESANQTENAEAAW